MREESVKLALSERIGVEKVDVECILGSMLATRDCCCYSIIDRSV